MISIPITKDQGPNKRRKFLGYTWLGWLNRILLQWFFIRLSELQQTSTQDHIAWQISYWIVPCTGWTTDYRTIGGEMKHFPNRT